MDAPQYLTVRNWTKFQHYKDRTPPWIKLHFELLTSPDWVMLSDASKVLAVVCMLVASRNEGRVPNNPAYIQRVGQLEHLPIFKPLIDSGFLESVADASTTLADACPRARSREAETETDKETEVETPMSPKPKTKATKSENSKIRLEQFISQHGSTVFAEWGRWAHEHLGWNEQRIGFEWEGFLDYWTSGNAVGGGLKSDWPATWRSHCRRQAQNGRRGGSSGSSSGGGLAAAVRGSVAARNGVSQSGGGERGGATSGEAEPQPARQRDSEGNLAIPY